MMRHPALLALLLAGALSLALFSVKYQVQDLEKEFAGLNRSIVADQRAIHVLKAEWSHLNDPVRLRDLSARYLGLGPVEPEQLGRLDDLPPRPGRSLDADADGGTKPAPTARLANTGGGG